jgi:hypothetical protein
MIPRGGIDSQIEQRKMQFGANPQALQQRYGQSKQLLDLLALQQIAAEQQQKSQAMALQMQQNPATVADQLEQEVIQGKKAEMAQSLQGMQAMRAPKRSQSDTARGVAGALAQKQREQQSRMQKMAGSGIAGQPARNMERMYNGGIVGYKTGDPVEITAEQIAEERRKNPRLRGASDAAIREMLKRRASMFDFDVESMQETAARDPRAKGYLTSKREDRDAAIDTAARGIDVSGIPDITPKPKEEDAIDIAARGINVAGIPDIPRKFDTESEEFQAFLEEAAGGYGRAPQQRQALLEDLAPTQGMPTPQAPSRPDASELPEDMAGALERSMQRGAAPASPATPAAAPKEDRLGGIYSALESSVKQEAEDIKRAREALEAQYGGRTKGKKFLDRLIAASQTMGSGRPATSNRQALSRLLGGYAGAAGAEREAEKKGLEAIAERQRQLTQGQLGVATGLAGIKRGEEMTELERARLAQQESQFSREMGQRDTQFEKGLAQKVAEMGQQGEQFDRTMVLKGKELAARVLKDAGQEAYQRESLQIQRDLNAIREEASRATSQADRNRVVTELRKNNTAQATALRNEKQAALEALALDPAYTSADATGKQTMRDGIAKAYDAQIAGYKLDTDQLIKDLTGVEVPRTESSAPTTGQAVDFGSLPK